MWSWRVVGWVLNRHGVPGPDWNFGVAPGMVVAADLQKAALDIDEQEICELPGIHFGDEAPTGSGGGNDAAVRPRFQLMGKG